jgi:hypothetical protein
MTRLPAPNPQFLPKSSGILTAGTKEAAEVAAQYENAAARRLQVWRLHQDRCGSCRDLADTEQVGPGCDDGYRLWYRWKNAQDRADAMTVLLVPDDRPQPAGQAPDPLRLF